MRLTSKLHVRVDYNIHRIESSLTVRTVKVLKVRCRSVALSAVRGAGGSCREPGTLHGTTHCRARRYNRTTARCYRWCASRKVPRSYARPSFSAAGSTMALPWSVGRPRVAFGTTVSPKHSALRTPLSGAVKELGERRLLRDTGRACLIRLYAAA